MSTVASGSILAMLNDAKAIITDDHFVHTSGLHGSTYINKDGIYPDPELVSALCQAMACHFTGSWMCGQEYDTVVGPAMGGIILAQWTAHWSLDRHGKKPFAVYAEKEGDGFVFRRGYDAFVRDRRVLIVEDVLTTGCSVRKVVEAVRAIGGTVMGVAALCNRGGVTAEALGGIPNFFSLLSLDLETWEEEDCPFCKEGRPVNVEFGKGREFLERRGGA
jgi:orotate phosphoribosyltransferase